MFDVRSLPRWKRAFLCFSIILCLITVNLSIFSFCSSANSADSSYNLYTIGSPVRLEASTLNGTSILINRPNVYYCEYDGSTPQWYEGTSSTSPTFSIQYSQQGNNVADMFINFSSSVSLDSIDIDRPVYFQNFNDLNNNFNFNIGLNNPLDRFGYALSSVNVIYSYIFLYATPTDDDYFFIRSNVVTGTVNVPVNSNYALVPFYNSSVLTTSVLDSMRSFVSSYLDDPPYCWLQSAHLKVDGAFVSKCFFEPSSNTVIQTLSSYENLLNAHSLSIYDAQEVNSFISFADLDWTSWLTNSVGAFMDFEIVPGLSISGIFALLIGMSLFMIFLKVFAGG